MEEEMKLCICDDKHIWYGMRVYLDSKARFYQKCPTCKGRIETGETFDQKAYDEMFPSDK